MANSLPFIGQHLYEQAELCERSKAIILKIAGQWRGTAILELIEGTPHRSNRFYEATTNLLLQGIEPETIIDKLIQMIEFPEDGFIHPKSWHEKLEKEYR